MVKAWKEKVVIPTYEVGKPEKNPIFLEKRVYQGSSGVVYPYPVIESISNEKTDKEYEAIYIENEYIKVMILPELGGRVHSSSMIASKGSTCSRSGCGQCCFIGTFSPTRQRRRPVP